MAVDGGGRLRIAILAPVWFPVPPERYGGIESVVALLADELVRAGHAVTLFASGESRTSAELVSVYERAPSASIGETWPDLRHVLACYGRAADFDVVNDHTGLLGLALAAPLTTPVVHTVHAPLDGEFGDVYEWMARVAPQVAHVSVSMSQQRARPELPWLANVYNAVDLELHAFSPDRGSYLLFLGRMAPDKGCHHAIDVARAAELPLKIAAKNREPAERRYFAERIEPFLGAGVEYVGEPGPEEKVQLLQHARATLLPLEREEPFGLVVAESLACGTPVVATRRGSMGELVEHGRTGFLVEELRDLVPALARLGDIDPRECRRQAEERFEPARMASEYLQCFDEAISRVNARARS